jgi:hypothetical protein
MLQRISLDVRFGLINDHRKRIAASKLSDHPVNVKHLHLQPDTHPISILRHLDFLSKVHLPHITTLMLTFASPQCHCHGMSFGQLRQTPAFTTDAIQGAKTEDRLPQHLLAQLTQCTLKFNGACDLIYGQRLLRLFAPLEHRGVLTVDAKRTQFRSDDTSSFETHYCGWYR